ncbi:hypothetical protein FQA39_LY00864 [Lamprigera yunnana]|nr:hypothetical protein FQA39_LY00864 [Lamprigera yunnana]
MVVRDQVTGKGLSDWLFVCAGDAGVDLRKRTKQLYLGFETLSFVKKRFQQSIVNLVIFTASTSYAIKDDAELDPFETDQNSDYNLSVHDLVDSDENYYNATGDLGEHDLHQHNIIGSYCPFTVI